MAYGPGVDLIPQPAAHGGDVYRVARWLGCDVAHLVDLSISLNPAAPDVTAIVAEHADAARHYPDAERATNMLAAAIDVEPDRLVITHGGSEAIALVAALERAGSVVEPEFSLYRRHLQAVSAEAPRWRSNPSNPLGTFAPHGATARVWDEAFYPFTAGAWTRGDADAWRVGSLTKLWACPGIRIGYAIAPTTHEADRLRAMQPAWPVGGIGLAVIEQLLPVTDLASWANEVRRLRSVLVAELRERDIAVQETDANWVLVFYPRLRELLLPHGVLVRDCTNYGLDGTARIAVPTDEERQRLVNALDHLGPPPST